MSSPQLFRHMAPLDIPLFATYLLSAEGRQYTNWEFDVIVGDPHVPPPHFPPAQRRQAAYLNSLKIDAVGWLFGSPTLIECKPNANLGAYGQAIGYRKWYRAIFQFDPRSLIVCERMSNQIKALCLDDNIEFRIVEPGTDLDVMKSMSIVRPLIKKLSVAPYFQDVM